MTKTEPKDEFIRQILEAHNRRRKAHESPELHYSEELEMLAQEWAERCAKHAHIMFSEISGIGENITFFPKTIDPESIVEHWYSEHVKYEFETPGWQPNTNYFTQVIWKATEEVGIGRAWVEEETEENHNFDKNHLHFNHPHHKNGHRITGKIADEGDQVVVAFYRPAGNSNRAGQFAVNVKKPEKTKWIEQPD
ncbi:hypothetical protein WR25_21494 [Diploscapter pachys]|uniref:SCP domain-containing protein n=1 Tax=Diploscapter pachys TaxID=2018661 RepID=A0A2A2J4Q0_9BILA|nr:hypothetical protein WR25_23390 [Diploscapter pachys]PAV91000.1 hypothetical protein WR25_21494 [Diploscapter pachys]